jgi:hypothetical protein
MPNCYGRTTAEDLPGRCFNPLREGGEGVCIDVHSVHPVLFFHFPEFLSSKYSFFALQCYVKKSFILERILCGHLGKLLYISLSGGQ